MFTLQCSFGQTRYVGFVAAHLGWVLWTLREKRSRLQCLSAIKLDLLDRNPRKGNPCQGSTIWRYA